MEEGIPSEADRVEKSRGHRNTAVTKTEIGKDMFPSTAVVWTTIARKRMSEIFTEATGEYVEDEEEEYLCQVEQQRQHKKLPDEHWRTIRPKTEGQTYEVQCVKERVHQEMCAHHKHKQKEEELDHWSTESKNWEPDSDYDDCEDEQSTNQTNKGAGAGAETEATINQTENEAYRVMGEGASAPPSMQQQKEGGQHPQVMGEGATEAPSFLSEKPDFKKWAEDRTTSH